MERIDASAEGRVEVAGRWFGVRGRRFVRPALTISHKGPAVRALAELDHKPWAAVDGEVWLAVFSVDDGLDGAREIELSVAPDIVVELRRKGRKLARPGDTLAAGAAARTSRMKNETIVAVPDTPENDSTPAGEPAAQAAPTPRRRPSQSAELERLGARLAAANDALEQERGRRVALGQSLEEERTTNRQLRTELGQARSELEVAAAARVQAAAVEAELEEARRELRDAQRRHEADVQALTRGHEEATQALALDHQQVNKAHAALEAELSQHAAALESTREALAAERTEAGRLRNRLAQVQEARRRGAGPPARPAGEPPGARNAGDPPGGGTAGDPPGGGTGGGPPGAGTAGDRSGGGTTRAAGTGAAGEAAGTAATAGGKPRASRRAASRAAARDRERDPTETQRFDVLGFDDELETDLAPPPPSRHESRRARHQAPDPPPVAERLRPLNPSLRHRTWWFGRLLALLVLCGVIAAVWIVLHSTVLH